MSFEVIQLVDESFPVKEVNYFGVILQVPEEHKFIATDRCGEVFSYVHKPVKGNVLFKAAELGQDFSRLGQVEFSGNWEESLVQV